MTSPLLPDDWCHTHQCSEPDQPGDYRVCGECGHVFRTREELVLEDLLWQQSVDVDPEAQPVSAESIYSCPHCTHDF